MKNETSPLGARVGKPHADETKSRHIKIQIKNTAGRKGAPKGHRRQLVRPVHQGGSFSSEHLNPRMSGASDKSRKSVFGAL